jgi:hypothetical protein
MSTVEPTIAEALSCAQFDEVGRLAELAASYWRSIALGADRGDLHLVTLHCKQVARVTREAFALLRTIGSDEAEQRGPPDETGQPQTLKE